MSARVLVIVGVAAVLACVYGAVFEWAAFLRSWLTATLLWGALPLGALGVLMTHGLTGGAWGDHTRNVWLALAATMPLFALALLLMLPGMGELFSWTRPVGELPEVVQRKRFYLNEPFFIVRSLIYVLIWIGLVWLLGAWRGRARGVNAPGLILWVFTLTFFGFDWMLSLEPKFYTDVFGFMLVTGTAGTGMAVGLLLVAPAVTAPLRRDLANIWLAVLLSWAFMAFSQYIIIWSANLPHEIEWYIARQDSPWSTVNALALSLFLILPFCILLSTKAKDRSRWLTIAAVSCLFGHVLYVHWLVVPAFGSVLPAQYWLDPAAVIALGSGFVWLIARRLVPGEQHRG